MTDVRALDRIDLEGRDNDYRFLSDRALGATTTYGVTSISVLATKH